ncbi:MAG: nitrous oxide reductase accessory protein NosL [Flavobacteriales bacterium]|nr:nitrous oxide reductase accessory protein NosL [Flavobacteriales bacterium]
MMSRAIHWSILLFLLPSLWSCGQQNPRIEFGKAECAHCRMNVVDQKFGAALTTVKGRQYVFDDLSCMVQFVGKGTVAEDQVAGWYVCDHAHPGQLIDATQALYLHGPEYRSPMRGDMAAFARGAERDQAASGKEAKHLDWKAARSVLQE